MVPGTRPRKDCVHDRDITEKVRLKCLNRPASIIQNTKILEICNVSTHVRIDSIGYITQAGVCASTRLVARGSKMCAYMFFFFLETQLFGRFS